MKISYNWLKDYLECDLAPEAVAKALTSIGLEVDALEEIEEIKRYGLKRFEYIELTEEILLNNGFTKCFDDVVEFDFYEDSHNNITMCNNSYMLNTKNKWHIHIDNRDMDSIMTCELTYVHELQRILKHVKIDKQIKLEKK